MKILRREFGIYYLLKEIRDKTALYKFQAKWRKENRHNETIPGNIFPMDRVSVGKMTYGELFVAGFDRPDTRLSIGNYCSIAGKVKFFIGGEHPKRYLSTFPFSFYLGWNENGSCESSSKGSITVEDDVWIGSNVIILSGVTIGQGAIIGAGSVVAKNIPPYSVYAGGRIIRKRFSEDVIALLKNFDFEKININAYREFCRTDITEENCSEIISKVTFDNDCKSNTPFE